MATKNTKVVAFRIDEELDKDIKTLSRDCHINISSYMRSVIADKVKKDLESFSKLQIAK